MLRVVFAGLAALTLASSTIAQTSAQAQASRPKISRPALQDAQADTLTMTCSDAVRMVQSSQGVVLRTGPNRWDRYVHDAEACGNVQRELIPQFVRTRDSRACHIGYTCDELDVGQ